MRLSGEEEKRLTKRHTENPRAYQLYLQGRYHWNKETRREPKKGIEFFQRAIEVDSKLCPRICRPRGFVHHSGIPRSAPAERSHAKAKQAAKGLCKLTIVSPKPASR